MLKLQDSYPDIDFIVQNKDNLTAQNFKFDKSLYEEFMQHTQSFLDILAHLPEYKERHKQLHNLFTQLKSSFMFCLYNGYPEASFDDEMRTFIRKLDTFKNRP